MVIAVMIVMMGIRILIKALLTMEHQEIHTEGIESRDEHTRKHCKMRKTSGRQRAEMRGFDDVFFGIETSKQRCADQSERAQQRGNPCDRHVFAQRAHVANILVVMAAHDDRACAQEKQRFKEGMRHQVENCHRISRCSQSHRHVTQLRERRVSHDAFDVVLNDAHEAHEERRD